MVTRLIFGGSSRRNCPGPNFGASPPLLVTRSHIHLNFAYFRHEDKEFIVPLNNNLSQPPSVRCIQTSRDIYLPDGNFGVFNSGYFAEDTAEGLPVTNQSQQFDTIEVEMQFAEDSLESSTDAIDADINIEETDAPQSLEGGENGISQGSLSFYNTAYTHL